MKLSRYFFMFLCALISSNILAMQAQKTRVLLVPDSMINNTFDKITIPIKHAEYSDFFLYALQTTCTENGPSSIPVDVYGISETTLEKIKICLALIEDKEPLEIIKYVNKLSQQDPTEFIHLLKAANYLQIHSLLIVGIPVLSTVINKKFDDTKTPDLTVFSDLPKEIIFQCIPLLPVFSEVWRWLLSKITITEQQITSSESYEMPFFAWETWGIHFVFPLRLHFSNSDKYLDIVNDIIKKYNITLQGCSNLLSEPKVRVCVTPDGKYLALCCLPTFDSRNGHIFKNIDINIYECSTRELLYTLTLEDIPESDIQWFSAWFTDNGNCLNLHSQQSFRNSIIHNYDLTELFEINKLRTSITLDQLCCLNLIMSKMRNDDYHKDVYQTLPEKVKDLINL